MRDSDFGGDKRKDILSKRSEAPRRRAGYCPALFTPLSLPPSDSVNF